MAPAKKTKAKAKEFTRCPHCSKRYGSEETLAAHVNEHRAKVRNQLLSPEHQAVLHPAVHHAMLKVLLKKAGHG
jgi:hypothetical protein